MLSEKQKQIVEKANEQGGTITKKEAVELIGNNYFINADKHTGDVLSRMVTRKILIRVKPGVFKINTQARKINNTDITNPNQLKLL